MEINELSKILSYKYSNAYNGEKVVQIHLFGIKYGGIIRSKKISAKDIITEAGLNESYITELNKGIKLRDSVAFETEELQLNDLAKILKASYDNSKDGETVASIFLFGIKYGKLIKINNFSISEIIKISEINESYFAELNKGIKLSEYTTLK